MRCNSLVITALRLASNLLQMLKACTSRAATCGLKRSISITLSATKRYPLPSSAWKCGILRLKLINKERALFGFSILNLGWPKAVWTCCKVSLRRLEAISAKYLSITKASSANLSANCVNKRSRISLSLLLIADKIPHSWVMFCAIAS